MVKEEGTHWEQATIVEATIELKNWAWEAATHLMEDPLKKIKTIEPLIPTKNIISIPIESISTSIIILVESVCDRVSIPRESIPVESVKNFTRHNMINNSAYYLVLNVFIS